MKSSKVAKRYARALAGLSTDPAQLEAWGVELERLAQLVGAPEVAAQLASPEVSPSARIRALTVIGERLGLSFPLRSFGAVVARHGRIEDLPAIAEAYRRILDDLMGRVRPTITFARSPYDAELAQVLAGLEAIAHKKIIPTVRVDAALLGGVVVELEGKTYDGSLATRLAEAQRRLAG
ncbi:MAG TPA: ATP synthase F1 subunit delta [Candidatus Binataceae bacterium]|nr:ATP synthase F1 subunit delta [Candidatus Binataceae bacterium]